MVGQISSAADLSWQSDGEGGLAAERGGMVAGLLLSGSLISH